MTLDNNFESAYGRQLADGYSTLRFRRRLESEYRDRVRSENLRQMRYGIGIALLLLAGLMAADWIYMPEAYGRTARSIGVGLVIPGALLLLALSTVRRARRLMQPLTAMIAFSGGLAYIGLMIIAVRDGLPVYYSGFVTITVFVYLFLGLGFYTASVVALSLFLIYAGATFSAEGLTMNLAYNLLFGAFANLVGLHGAYVMEHRRRRGYLEARLLENVAGQDKLTGLANRRRFDEQLEFAWQQARTNGGTLALLIIDIDHFKRYNDHFGHQAGDRALRKVAGTIARTIRRPTDLAGRFGGEEFVVLLTATERQYAVRFGEQIRERVIALEIPHPADGANGRLTVSIGIATIEPATADRSLEGFIQLADEALYTAKEGGRNRVQLAGSDTSIHTGIFRGVTTDSYPVNTN